MAFWKKEIKPAYKIVFCDENDLSTQFGENIQVFPSYESAKNKIISKNSGWGYAIQYEINDGWKIDGGWLKIKRIK